MDATIATPLEYRTVAGPRGARAVPGSAIADRPDIVEGITAANPRRSLASRAITLVLGAVVAAQALLSIPSSTLAASPVVSPLPVLGSNHVPKPGGASGGGQQVQAFGGGTPVTSMILTASCTVRVEPLPRDQRGHDAR